MAASVDSKSFTTQKFACRSEFSKNIRSYNTAINSSMNRHLAQALRDAHATVDTLNRSQQTTYKTMCKIMQIQRQKVKETYQLYQQGLRDDEVVSAQRLHLKVKRQAVHGTKLPPIEQKLAEHNSTVDDTPLPHVEETEETKHSTQAPVHSTIQTDAEQPSNSNDDISTQSQDEDNKENITVSLNKTLSLNADPESRETIQINSVVSEPQETDASNVDVQSSPSKPFLDFPSRFINQKAFFTASLRSTLPPINEFAAATELAQNKLDEDPKVEVKPKNPRLPMIQSDTTKSTYAGSSKGGFSSMERRSDSPDNVTAISAQKAMSLRARIAEIEKQHLKDFLKKQNLETKKKPYEMDNSEPVQQEVAVEPTKLNKSIAAERRKLAKLRAEHRKAVLNSENCYNYTQLSNGNFLQAATSYKRKHFLPPSNRAKQQRDKILKSEASRAEMNDERIGEFFTRIDLPVPNKVKVLQRKETKGVLDLSDIKPVIDEPVVKKVVKVKPLTEVAKDVNYIREYIRPADRKEKTLRNTSWEQRY